MLLWIVGYSRFGLLWVIAGVGIAGYCGLLWVIAGYCGL